MEKDGSQDTAWTGVGGGQGVREHQLISLVGPFILSFMFLFYLFYFLVMDPQT